MAKMNWDKVRQQNLMSRPKTGRPVKAKGTKRFIPPTEKQIKYMKVLGIPYRAGMSLGDCSSLISYTIENKDKVSS